MTVLVTKRDWTVITGLWLLALIPSVAGGVRAAQLAGGVARTAANARFVDMPAPVLVHIAGAVLYSFLGALQFAPGFRRRHRTWHRVTGRVLLVAGVAVALSGLWMTTFYDLPRGDNTATNAARYVVGMAMLASLVLGFAAIRRRDLPAHRAWMTRAYALAMGAGTQVLTSLPLIPVDADGPAYPAWRSVAMISAWVLNLAVAELVIRRARPARTPSRAAAGAGARA